MKFLLDLLPIVLFFVAFKVWNIYIATGVTIATVLMQVAWSGLHHCRVHPILWVNLAIVVIFGGSTLVLHNDTFIKWKPTVLYWAFSLAIMFSQFGLRKNLIHKIVSTKIKLPPEVWNQLNIAWMLFFVVLGIANLFIAYRFSSDTWVNFKLFGTTGAMLLFIIVQSLWLAQYAKEG
ncbi:septation protein A [Candidatus Vallotia cooleyia]|uniref:septation protein A n=1 Tax=Candidatus Vallotiella adelgis TaxID=1177211 RepID=UPI001D03077B|nr:septation protein A [Candidatus Vallotia cooleyia]UDG82274.1 Intracellular septation protein [Candidatus Vallotia cooleyia]